MCLVSGFDWSFFLSNLLIMNHVLDTSTPISSSLDDVPPYMPIQGQRRNNQTDKKKKSKTADGGVSSFFKVFK